MKKNIFLIICISFFILPTEAQHIDSLQTYPFLYLYNWEGVGVYHNDTLCTLATGGQLLGSSVNARWSPQRNNIGGYALYQHCDSTIHAIGIACSPPFGRGYQPYRLTLYDSSMTLLKGLITTRPYTQAERDSACYLLALPGTNHWSFFSDYYFVDCMLLQYVFFDDPIDLTGDFYIGRHRAAIDTLFTVQYYVEEIHEPPYHIGRIPFKVYLESTKEWVDDTLEHELPELFLIIEPECHGAENISVATDSSGCVHVEWDTLRWQEQWVLRLDGPGGTRYDTVDTCSHTYCGLDLNRHYEFSIMSQCYLPGGKHNWSPWSAPATIGVVGIPEIETPNPTIEIYPNPATEQVEDTSSLPMARIVATDALGHRLLDRPATGLKATLDVSRWPAGAYLLQVHTATGIASRKLLVQ